jgi:Cyclin, N-terminal domain
MEWRSYKNSRTAQKGVNFITQVGMLLKLPQLTLATASVYLHRFFMRHFMVDLPNRPGLHHYAIAATALFLATKESDVAISVGDGQRGLKGEASTPDSMTPNRTYRSN